MNNFIRYDVAVIGGGAAGFFGAIQIAERSPRTRVVILEKSTKVLAKVKVSGGGRCNVTHACHNPFQLADHYPRGEKALKNLFKEFQATDMVEWLKGRGVSLKTESDGRIFPTSDSSDTIINTFLNEAQKRNIDIRMNHEVDTVSSEGDVFHILTVAGEKIPVSKILIATGGSPKMDSYQWIRNLGHTIKPPIPSLFTFNDPNKTLADLMGISVPNGEVKIATTKFIQSGPILITHWGLSGPAIIKLSAWAAEELHQRNYTFTALVSWIGSISEDETRSLLSRNREERGNQKVFTHPLNNLPSRLWERLCSISGIGVDLQWRELSNRSMNKLLESLIRFPFQIGGKTTFKEEFVTCGGVPCAEVNLKTLESKIIPRVYFAGEVLDIDGETGGFNFQGAWTTSYIAAKSIALSLKVP